MFVFNALTGVRVYGKSNRWLLLLSCEEGCYGESWLIDACPSIGRASKRQYIFEIDEL